MGRGSIGRELMDAFAKILLDTSWRPVLECMLE